MSLFATQNVPYLGFSAIVFLFSFWISKRVGQLVEASWSATAGRKATSKFLRRFAQLSTLLLGMSAALSISGIDTSILVGATTFAIGYALRSWIANLLSGVIIAVSKVIGVGWYVTTSEGGGSVMEISAMNTRLKTISNQTILIPNSALVSEPLTLAGQYPERLVKLEYWLMRDTNPTRVIEIVETFIQKIPELSQTPEPPMVLLSDFSRGPLVFTVRFWVSKAKLKVSIFKYKARMNLRIWKALEDAGMDMPYPVTTLSANAHDSGNLPSGRIASLLQASATTPNIG